MYSARPTKTPVEILHFAEDKKEPLFRKVLRKAAQKALGKGTGPSNLPKPILASFCHASKNGRKKARKSLKLLGFSQRHLFWCSLMVDLKRLELSTSRMRTERSPERDITHPLSIWKGMDAYCSKPAQDAYCSIFSIGRRALLLRF